MTSPNGGLALPPLLPAVGALLTRHQSLQPDRADWQLAADVVRRGGGQDTPTAALSSSVSDLSHLRWFRLQEAAAAGSGAVVEERLRATISAVAATRSRLVLTVGSDGEGQAGVAVGLSRDSDAVPLWLAGQAPDLVWTEGGPPGWSVVADPAHLEYTLTPRPVALEPTDTAGPDRERPTALAGLLGLPYEGWCLVVVAEPLAASTLRAAGQWLADLTARVARHLVHTEAATEVTSHSVNDPVVESVASSLGAWAEVIDDGLRCGGFEVAVHLCARRPEVAEAARAAFDAVLTRSVAGTPPTREQRWDQAACAPGAPRAFGWLSAADLATVLLPPAEAVGSLLVRRALPAGRRLPHRPRPVNLGRWLGTTLEAGVDVGDLSGHAFVAGITGSGKSTTTARMLVGLWNDHGVPFLVIDPAKADYEEVAEHLDGGLTVVSGAELSMNILTPWPGRPATTHIQTISAAFRGAFGMPVPVPYVAALLLDDLAAAAEAGATLTLHDAMAALDPLVADLGYAGEVESNIRASLGLRLRMLLQPGRAERVAGSGPPTWLVDRPTLVRLGDIGDDEERAFLAAVLVVYIAEAAKAGGQFAGVRHVTVVEEAHRLMPEPTASPAEEGNAASVAARLFTQLLAEVRAYGEALVVVDQSPAAVAREVLRNTNLKLAHRIVDADDQRSLGAALGLPEEDVAVLGSLGTGRCLIASREFVRPQTLAVDRLPAPGTVGLRPPGAGLRRLSAAGGGRCHAPSDHVHHHSSEHHGRTAELAVALWTGGAPSSALLSLLRPVTAEHPRTRLACLVGVGVRRHVATLVRLGMLGWSVAPDYEHELWQAFMADAVSAPPLPERSTSGPFHACALCPDPCRARPVVASGGLTALTRARRAAAHAKGGAEAATAALAAAEDVRQELMTHVPTTTALATGWCAAVYVSAASGTEQALVAAASSKGT